MITILSLWAYKVIFWPGAVYTELSSILGGQLSSPAHDRTIDRNFKLFIELIISLLNFRQYPRPTYLFT